MVSKNASLLPHRVHVRVSFFFGAEQTEDRRPVHLRLEPHTAAAKAPCVGAVDGRK